MIHHVLNSSLVSGPESLVLPNLQGFAVPSEIVLLQESRRKDGATVVAGYARGLGFSVHEVTVAGRLDLRAVRALRAFWRQHQPSIIHAHGPKASFYSMLARPDGPDRPWLLTTHHGVRANDQSLKLRLFEAVYEKLVIPRTDLSLTVCTSDHDLLIRRGVTPQKLAVHLNGISRKLISVSERSRASKEVRQTWFRALNVDLSSAFLIGVVGRLAPEKQHELILESFARLRNARPTLNAHLLCFGSGPLESILKRRTSALHLDERVHWMGYRPDVSSEMTGLDVLLSVSAAEGLPINLIEAGWAGVPVVANAVGGVSDLIQHGETGILLQPPATVEAVAHSLQAIHDDADGAAKLADRFQARVTASFSKDTWAGRLLEIYTRFPPRR